MSSFYFVQTSFNNCYIFSRSIVTIKLVKTEQSHANFRFCSITLSMTSLSTRLVAKVGRSSVLMFMRMSEWLVTLPWKKMRSVKLLLHPKAQWLFTLVSWTSQSSNSYLSGNNSRLLSRVKMAIFAMFLCKRKHLKHGASFFSSRYTNADILKFIQWNPVNTITNGPKKLGRFNEVTVLTMVFLFWRRKFVAVFARRPKKVAVLPRWP